MKSVQTRNDVRQQLARWRVAGDRIAVVPTMGNLHDGHLSLIRIARANADRVVVTIFVNPTQFAAGEDFETYPRTLEQDAAMLRAEAVDLLFAPDVDTIYPFGLRAATRVSVPGITDELCGAGRPGHFDGVATVIMRLFTLLQPDVAVFGQKDFQQQLVVRHLVADFGLNVDILLGPVIREASGLAMSSRNARLSAGRRKHAARLYGVLRHAADEVAAGRRDFAVLESDCLRRLGDAGHEPEYFAIRQAADLAVPGTDCSELVILAASRLDSVRLIDNVLVATR